MTKKDEPKKEIPFLAEEFERWYGEMYDKIDSFKNKKSPTKKMLERLNLSEEKYYQIYIEPYRHLNKQELEATLNLLAPEIVHLYLKEGIDPKCNLTINMDVDFQRKENALDWLLFQVAELNFFTWSPKLYNKIQVPKNQCFYCGQPDFYIKFGQIKFNGRDRFCHKIGCQKGANPEKHVDGCCYKNWARRKKTLEDKLDKACVEFYEKREDFEDGKLSRDKELRITQKARKVFIEFCEKQYAENLKINYTIQEGPEPALNLNDFYS